MHSSLLLVRCEPSHVVIRTLYFSREFLIVCHSTAKPCVLRFSSKQYCVVLTECEGRESRWIRGIPTQAS